ncbi:hypothetical protein M409DRAFT_70271 [Zasmidium cellare ATCC 36951]|uniref:RING-type domain-containing protein n=1 Tax=Zasmidium cellare ATCC 36951 TaxID=1080233 RepID=A0A6A6C4F8_ZASCE|nr:uncharacterized protein M409DRAFT_70271 [Zasmidium cellare ATCC 36951]KAF2160742.1 hypothetical protein M409DRAFT_70271 [Zasmidium cellare ATCC 36951]
MPRWYPIEEDKSEPCADELEYIKSKGDRSATDYTHWEKEAFFAIDDPEITPLESGRIDWLVEGFNGTKENPNSQEVMRSQIQRIGGLDWQIRLYPRGVPGSEYLSVFIECVSMLSDDYAAMEDFKDPPFPFLRLASSKQNKVKKRRSVAAQLAVVMYNPDEPRVFEYQTEAHQFHKMSTDYGWKYFTRFPRYEFHVRQHGQRQAILRGDKLAFLAYIRTVDDPTGCLWEHGDQSADGITAVTGLRPFRRSLVYTASAIPLLHFAPFRKFAQDLPPGAENASVWLHPLLLKMYSRKRSPNYGNRGSQFDIDVMEMLWRMASGLPRMYPDGPESGRFNELVGSFHAEKGAVCGSNRLNTKEHPSIQQAVDSHPKLIARPALLTLELQRQEHDKTERKWKKLTNKVKCDETLNVGGTSYTLFAFITHCGHLRSCRYNSYVRPRGPGKGWYAYQDSNVTRLTEKQARERHSGAEGNANGSRKSEDGYDSPFSEFHEPTSEVTCAVMYVRDDMAEETFNAPDVEEWRPDYIEPINDLYDLPIKSAIHENFGHANVPNINAPPAVTEEEFARLQEIAARIDQAATEATPEPPMMDGEDVVMRDADDDSTFDIESQETSPMYDGKVASAGTKDWLGQAYYEGHFNEHGAFHGGGHHIATNGDEYLGEFRDGEYSGYGKLIYALTGNIYEGEFKNGRPEGRGKLTEASSTGNVYEGGFRDGKKHGDFVLTGKVTDEDQSHCHICYDKDITTAFYDCGHVVACRDCAAQIDVCPVCRRRVVARLQLYGVRVSNA